MRRSDSGRRCATSRKSKSEGPRERTRGGRTADRTRGSARRSSRRWVCAVAPPPRVGRIREVAVGNVGGERRRRGKRRRRGASPTKAATPNDGEAVSAVRAHDPGFENQARTNPRDESPNLREASRESRQRQPQFARVTAPFHAVRSAAGTFLPGTRIDIPPVGGRGDATSERRRAPTIRARRPLDAHPPSPRPRQPLHSSSSTAVAACTAASSVPPTVVPPPFGACPGRRRRVSAPRAAGPAAGGGARRQPRGSTRGTGGAPPPPIPRDV